MGRGRGKRRKQTTICPRDDPTSDEEKILTSKRRGRPQKLLKDDTEEDGLMQKMEKNRENTRNSTASKTSMDPVTSENERNSGLIKEEDDHSGSKSSADHNSVKPVGFRQNGSRRKSKPHRAAEVGVECK